MIMISIFFNLFKSKFINFLKSKYFYMALIFISISGYIIFLNIKLNSKYREIDKLNNNIHKLEYSNYILNKDIDFKERQLSIIENFKESDEYINNIDNKKLTDESIKALNSIINSYYKSLGLSYN